MNLSKNLGLILLGIWLIATGVLSLVGAGSAVLSIILAILAIAAGVVILLQGQSWSADIGMILLGIWLIATGLLSLLGVSFPGSDIILAILAIASGILILLRGSGWSARIGMILMGIWLILTGLVSVLDLSFSGSGIILAILAITAGVLILLGR